MKHQHAEAFCLMTYRCQECDHQERLWNSRDGVTPFGMQCPKCGGMDMLHVDWGDDERAPDHIPEPGQGVWIDLPQELRRPMAAARVQSFEGTLYEVVDQDRERLIHEIANVEFKAGEPFLIRWPGFPTPQQIKERIARTVGGDDDMDSD